MVAPVEELVAIDFDGTAAKTFVPSPNGRNVETGYRYGLEQLFGSATLLDEIGGLGNRSAAEVIAAVVHNDSARHRLGVARARPLMRELQHVSCTSYRGSKLHGRELLVETLVLLKLSHLLSEIGPEWPLPYLGVRQYLASLKQRGVETAIISSGHEVFIRKTFAQWGTPCPRFMITDDDVRRMCGDDPRLTKPNPFMFDLLKLRVGGVTGAHGPERIVHYLGDCPIKDRGLAKNAGVRFGWFNPEHKPPPDDFGDNEFEFHSWSALD